MPPGGGSGKLAVKTFSEGYAMLAYTYVERGKFALLEKPKPCLLYTSRDEFEIYVTEAPMDACRHIRETAADGAELRAYACGGDGTLNEGVNGAAGLSNVAVTHFPCGTGNDFIKMFGPGKDRFFDLTGLINGEVRPIAVSYTHLDVYKRQG